VPFRRSRRNHQARNFLSASRRQRFGAQCHRRRRRTIAGGRNKNILPALDKNLAINYKIKFLKKRKVERNEHANGNSARRLKSVVGTQYFAFQLFIRKFKAHKILRACDILKFMDYKYFSGQRSVLKTMAVLKERNISAQFVNNKSEAWKRVKKIIAGRCRKL